MADDPAPIKITHEVEMPVGDSNGLTLLRCIYYIASIAAAIRFIFWGIN